MVFDAIAHALGTRLGNPDLGAIKPEFIRRALVEFIPTQSVEYAPIIQSIIDHIDGKPARRLVDVAALNLSPDDMAWISTAINVFSHTAGASINALHEIGCDEALNALTDLLQHINNDRARADVRAIIRKLQHHIITGKIPSMQ